MNEVTQKISEFISLNDDIFIDDPVYQLVHLKHAPKMAQILYEIKLALAFSGKVISSVVAGSYYYLLDSLFNTRAVFKPFSVPGYGDIYRECLAYRLDKDHFIHVPDTTITTLTHPTLAGTRTGSCQIYIPNSNNLASMTQSQIRKLDMSQIRKIALFDMRVLNQDRHPANLLKSGNVIYPVDHASILPEQTVNCIFCWLDYPELIAPMTDEEYEYLLSIDLKADLKMMQVDYQLSKVVRRRYEISYYILLAGKRLKWTLNDIGNLYVIHSGQSRISTFSQIELALKGCHKLEEAVLNQMQWRGACV